MVNKCRYRKMKKRDAKAVTKKKLEKMWNVRLKIRSSLEQAGTSSCCDVPEINQENSTENKDQELSLKIKKSLKNLEDQRSDSDNEHSPLFNLEPHHPLYRPEETKQDQDTDKVIEEEPSAEFHDESQPQELLCIRKDKPKPKPKPKPRKLPIKPKRNPRRSVVIEQEIRKSIIAARKAPALEKVFVKSEKNPEKDNKTNKGKKTNRETSKIPSNFYHTEQLYEFGKYVAEQMMCFDEEDVRLAQTEIKEVLTKFRLKYKIMNVMSKTSNRESTTDTDRHIYIEVTQSPSNMYSPRRSVTRSEPEMKSDGRSVIDAESQAHFTGRSVTKSVTQVDTAGLSVTRTGLPQAISFVPPLNELGVLNRNSSSSTPLSFVIAPTMAAPGFQITTQRVDSAGTIASQPEFVNSVGISVSQPVSLQRNNEGSTATQPGFSDMISAGTSVTPGNSRTPETQFELPITHFIDVTPVNAEPESLIIKCEVEIDEEI